MDLRAADLVFDQAGLCDICQESRVGHTANFDGRADLLPGVRDAPGS